MEDGMAASLGFRGRTSEVELELIIHRPYVRWEYPGLNIRYRVWAPLYLEDPDGVVGSC